MEYRSVGKTGLKISEMSFGCMRFADDESAVAAVRKAVELGVNYFDVAPLYGGGTAEPWLGAGLKGLRDRVIVTAKSSPGNGGDGLGEQCSPESGFGIRTADQVRRQIERSMQLLGVDHLDVYHLWACHDEIVLDEAMKPGGFLEGVRKAQSEGLLDHVGITSHMDGDAVIRCLQRYDFDLLTIPFFVFETSRARAVEYCAEHGIGVIAMNPLAGGALSRPSPVLQRIADDLGFESMTEAALRFLTSFPGITTALPGITYADQAALDVADVAKGPIGMATLEALRARVTELYANVRHFCTGCGYCGECPEGILIPKTLETYTNLLIPSYEEAALARLVDQIGSGAEGLDPSLCVACGSCEAKCPNKLPVSQLMSAAKEKWPG